MQLKNKTGYFLSFLLAFSLLFIIVQNVSATWCEGDDLCYNVYFWYNCEPCTYGCDNGFCKSAPPSGPIITTTSPTTSTTTPLPPAPITPPPTPKPTPKACGDYGVDETKTCGSGSCTGTQTCQSGGTWTSCSSSGTLCGDRTSTPCSASSCGQWGTYEVSTPACDSSGSCVTSKNTVDCRGDYCKPDPGSCSVSTCGYTGKQPTTYYSCNNGQCVSSTTSSSTCTGNTCGNTYGSCVQSGQSCTGSKSVGTGTCSGSTCSYSYSTSEPCDVARGTSCGTDSISCPKTDCYEYDYYEYPATSSCTKTCDGSGGCNTCTPPACTAVIGRNSPKCITATTTPPPPTTGPGCTANYVVGAKIGGQSCGSGACSGSSTDTCNADGTWTYGSCNSESKGCATGSCTYSSTCATTGSATDTLCSSSGSCTAPSSRVCTRSTDGIACTTGGQSGTCSGGACVASPGKCASVTCPSSSTGNCQLSSGECGDGTKSTTKYTCNPNTGNCDPSTTPQSCTVGCTGSNICSAGKCVPKTTHDCDNTYYAGDTKPCGSGSCTGTRTCQSGNTWTSCSTQNKVCATGTCSYSSTCANTVSRTDTLCDSSGSCAVSSPATCTRNTNGASCITGGQSGTCSGGACSTTPIEPPPTCTPTKALVQSVSPSGFIAAPFIGFDISATIKDDCNNPLTAGTVQYAIVPGTGADCTKQTYTKPLTHSGSGIWKGRDSAPGIVGIYTICVKAQ